MSMAANMSWLPIPAHSIVHGQRPDHFLPFLVFRRGAKCVCTLHGNPRRAIQERRGNLIGEVYALVEWMVLRRTKAVIAVDEPTRQEYLMRYPWLQDRLHIIPNGVDMESFRPTDQELEKKRWGLKGPALLYAGRLEQEKRVGDIIEAFRDSGLHSATLLIAGDGRARPRLEAAAEGMNVRFLGAVDHGLVPSLLNASEALVLFSTREGLPAIVLEALACNVPVIASPVGSIPAIVRTNENGILVSDHASLTAAMRSVVSGEFRAGHDFRQQLSGFSWSKVGSQVLHLYDQIGHG